MPEVKQCPVCGFDIPDACHVVCQNCGHIGECSSYDV